MSSARFCEAVKKWCSASFSQRLASLQRCIRFSLPGWHRNHVEAKHRGFGSHPTWFSAPFSVRWMTLQQCFDDLGSLLMLTRAKTKQNTHFNSESKWACSAHCVFSNLLPLLLFDLFLFHFSPLRPEDSLLHQCQDSLLFPRIHLALPQQYSSIFHPVLISCIAFLSHRTLEPPPKRGTLAPNRLQVVLILFCVKQDSLPRSFLKNEKKSKSVRRWELILRVQVSSSVSAPGNIWQMEKKQQT